MRGFKRTWDEERKVWKFEPREETTQKKDLPEIHLPNFEIPWTLIISIFIAVFLGLFIFTVGPSVFSGLKNMVSTTTETDSIGLPSLSPIGFIFVLSFPIIILLIQSDGRLRRISPITLAIWAVVTYFLWIYLIQPIIIPNLTP